MEFFKLKLILKEQMSTVKQAWEGLTTPMGRSQLNEDDVAGSLFKLKLNKSTGPYVLLS